LINYTRYPSLTSEAYHIVAGLKATCESHVAFNLVAIRCAIPYAI
jgi:hypothetical protein